MEDFLEEHDLGICFAADSTLRVLPGIVRLPDVAFVEDAYEAARDAHCVAICTEWPEYASVDLDRLRGLMARPVIADGRNLLHPEAVAEAGFVYASVGRPTVGQAAR